MDVLDEYLQDNLLSMDNILRLIDTYSIYSYYIGAELELRTRYSSPLREGDENPSFSMFSSRHDEGFILFKDSATGKKGSVFTFIRNLMSKGELIPMRHVLLQINNDFGLGLNGEEVGEFKPHLVKAPPIKRTPTVIQITDKPEHSEQFIKYWKDLGISKEVQDMYYATEPQIVHYIGAEHVTIYTRTLTIAYEILGKYKIYCPYEKKEFKFRNNYESNFVEGAMQLKFEKDFCIITKASKECMWFSSHFEWDSVAGKSENTMIPDRFMRNVLHYRYRVVFIWLDSDEAGVVAQQRYLDMYPWLIPIVMDENILQKDVTDFYLEGVKQSQAQKVLNYVYNLIMSKL